MASLRLISISLFQIGIAKRKADNEPEDNEIIYW